MNHPGLQHYERLSGSPQRRKLDRASLPSPVAYLTKECLLTGKARGEWANCRCPFHKNGAEENPSLRVSLADGHFKCHACGAKGGDVIALHRARTGQGFLDAVRNLGGRFE